MRGYHDHVPFLRTLYCSFDGGDGEFESESAVMMVKVDVTW